MILRCLKINRRYFRCTTSMQCFVLLCIFFWNVIFITSISVSLLGEDAVKTKSQLNEEYIDVAREMKELYDEGKLDDVIRMYETKCLKSSSPKSKVKRKAPSEKRTFKRVSRRIRADIYQWATLSYTALDMQEKADICLRKLLAARPGQETTRYWRIIQKKARESFVVAPRLLVGFKSGANFTRVNPYNRYSVLFPAGEPAVDFYEKDYSGFSGSRGTQIGLVVEYALTKHLSVCIQPALHNIKFQYKSRFKWQQELSGEEVVAKLTHKQKLYYLELPLLIKYRFESPKLKPYIQAGGFLRIRESANKNLRAVLLPETEGFDQEAKLDMKDQFAWGNGGLIVGIGVGYDTGNIRLEVELNYKHVFNNIINGKYRYDNSMLVYGFYDVFDDIKVKHWDLTVNVLLPITFKAFRR